MVVIFRKWLERFPWLIASVVYSFLRFIEDHNNLILLRNREVAFTISLLRDRFTDCLVIGRDLIRLLQNVSRIPEFEILWKDLLHNPQSLSPSLTNGNFVIFSIYVIFLLEIFHIHITSRCYTNIGNQDIKKIFTIATNTRYGT